MERRGGVGPHGQGAHDCRGDCGRMAAKTCWSIGSTVTMSGWVCRQDGWIDLWVGEKHRPDSDPIRIQWTLTLSSTCASSPPVCLLNTPLVLISLFFFSF